MAWTKFEFWSAALGAGGTIAAVFLAIDSYNFSVEAAAPAELIPSSIGGNWQIADTSAQDEAAVAAQHVSGATIVALVAALSGWGAFGASLWRRS